MLHTRGKGGATSTQRWNGSETAMVIIDMWSYHPCKTVTNRAGALVPRLNAVATAVRAAGGLVLFAPTDASEVYSGWPQRERVFQTPHVTPIFQNISVPSLASGLITGDDDECSDAGHGCVWNYGEARQNPAIIIEPSDYIVGGDTNPIDVYSVLTHHGIKNVLHAGIAENICVQAKCEGIPTLTKLGFNCALMRDLTDAQSHYEPQSYRGPGLPWVHMDWGTKNVTKSIEDQGIAVTVEGAALAVAAGAWPQSPPDPVLHAPWGICSVAIIYTCYLCVECACKYLWAYGNLTYIYCTEQVLSSGRRFSTAPKRSLSRHSATWKRRWDAKRRMRSATPSTARIQAPPAPRYTPSRSPLQQMPLCARSGSARAARAPCGSPNLSQCWCAVGFLRR